MTCSLWDLAAAYMLCSGEVPAKHRARCNSLAGEYRVKQVATRIHYYPARYIAPLITPRVQ